MLNYLSGIHVRAVIGMTADPKDDGLELAAHHIDDGLAISESVSLHSNPMAWIFRQLFISHHLYITVLYILLKLFNIANLVLQFVFLTAFLGPRHNSAWQWGWPWGMWILYDFGESEEWSETGRFPRVTMCDFEVRQLGQIQRWSVQCVLPYNMLNEKVYMFLWWWMTALFFITVFDCIKWIITMIIPDLRVMQINSLLAMHPPEIDTVRNVDKFVKSYLHLDGVLVLRLIRANADDMTTSSVVARLYALFAKREKKTTHNTS